MFYTNQEFFNAVEARMPSLGCADELYLRCTENGVLSRKLTDSMLKTLKTAILNRDPAVPVGRDTYGSMRYLNTAKAIRPWSIVPKLRDFRPPAGDFGVGVEIEYGFRTHRDAVNVMHFIRNWKHVALDREGGTYGVEATFPPILYSKMNKRSAPMRYLQYLAANPDIIAPHMGQVGTHINISASSAIDIDRKNAVNMCIRELSVDAKHKYFNRMPYGYINQRAEPSSSVSYVEMKLFNSTTCAVTLRRYINIAVSLVKLIQSDEAITTESVTATLEAGYSIPNGHLPA